MPQKQRQHGKSNKITLPHTPQVLDVDRSKGEPRGKVTNKFRNKGNIEERCNPTGEIRTWGISEQFVLSKRLFDKEGSKICLFWHTSLQKLKKIYPFSIRRKFIRIHLLMFWPWSSPSDFHRTSEDPNCLIKEDQCKNNNIFG